MLKSFYEAPKEKQELLLSLLAESDYLYNLLQKNHQLIVNPLPLNNSFKIIVEISAHKELETLLNYSWENDLKKITIFWQRYNRQEELSEKKQSFDIFKRRFLQLHEDLALAAEKIGLPNLVN